LYLEYSKNEFKDLALNKSDDPELYEFVERSKHNGLQFSKYSEDQLKRFIEEIYELRKN
jgi:hypothetical protein